MNFVSTRRARFFFCLLAVIGSGAAQAQTSEPQTTPPWAYPLLAPNYQVPPADDEPRHLPGSDASFTIRQLRDVFNAYDWFPHLHPPMPEVVVHGRQPSVNACGMCHMPNGLGRPENASLAGLPAEYIKQQMLDYQAGLRRTSEPRSGPIGRMLSVAKAVNADEISIAANYFSQLTYRKWIRVVEASEVPKAQVIVGSIWMPIKDGGVESIGQRIVELPEDPARTELRDPTSPFVAYVPLGSIKKGKQLATSNATIPCATCHGQDLKGVGAIPRIAGRSPSYLVRQLYDMKGGARAGQAAQLMQVIVANLSLDDMIALAAYVASLD